MTKRALLLVAIMAFMCLPVSEACAKKNSNAKWALSFAGSHNPSVNNCTHCIGDCYCEVIVDGPGSAGRCVRRAARAAITLKICGSTGS